MATISHSDSLDWILDKDIYIGPDSQFKARAFLDQILFKKNYAETNEMIACYFFLREDSLLLLDSLVQQPILGPVRNNA